MKKITASLLFSFGPLILSYFYSLPSGSAGYSDSRTGSYSTIPSALPAAPSISFNSLPLGVSDEAVRPLEQCQDQGLQAKLEAIIHSNRHWVELAKNKTLNIGIVDMQNPMQSRFAAINANNMIYAASLPKIAVLLAAEDAINQGKLVETPEVKQDMRMMIAKSSNEAASRMIHRVGIPQIASVLQDPCYNLYDKQNGGGLWVGKPYGGGGTRTGDPLKNLSHAASVFQVCKYYYMLAFGQLVSPDRSKDMLDLLSHPELHHKFVSVLDRVAPTAQVYRKSGTWENWHADSALVWDNNRRYIVVALADDPDGEKLLRELMLQIDTELASKG